MRQSRSRQSARIEANSNFHILCSRESPVPVPARYAEYRRRWEQDPANFSVGEFPLHLDIESTSACNLRCPFCASTHNDYRRGHMDLGLYRRIIEEGGENGLFSIKLNFRGEPLLHPRIADMVDYAKKRGIMDTYFNTNGTRLFPDVSRRLIDAGLDRISISFEGTDKETFERNRVGARYEDVLANIEALQELKRELGVAHPRVRIQSVLLPELEGRMEEYRDFWKERADEVAYLDMKDEPARENGVVYPWACPQLFQRMTVMFDGTLLPCCHDVFAMLSYGNVEEVRIRDAWLSGRQNRLRELHKKGEAHRIGACDGCPLRTSEVKKLMREEATAA